MGSYFSIHNHTYFSNYRLRDSVNKPEDVIDTAIEKGLAGVVITDHETISSGPQLIDYIQKLKSEDKLPEGFTFGMGNEAYLIDDNKRELVETQQKVKYSHFIMVAKNQSGFEFLKNQSSKAWGNRVVSRGMERVPTYKSELKELMKNHKGDVIASTACIGGELPQLILQLEDAILNSDKNEEKIIKNKIMEFISFLIDVFGLENVFFELQPSKNEEQLIINKWLPKIAKGVNVKCIVTTDAHYLSKEQQEFHKQYLQASEGEREVEAFYATTYIFSKDELLEYFEPKLLEELMENTFIIQKSLSDIEYKHETIIPKSHIPNFKQDENITKMIDLDKYKNIANMINSNINDDNYYHYKVMQGFIDKKQEFNDENLSRVDLEYGELASISEQLKQPMTSYFLAMVELVDIMWESSLVGVGRGSAVCYYTNYLLNIVQLNPITYKLPYWRFLSKEYVGEMPDIDVDAQGSQRFQIINDVKDKFGFNNVLNIGTYTTEGARSASLTACRAYGLDPETAQNITNLIPSEKGKAWDLRDVFLGNEKDNKKPSSELIGEVNNYPGLQKLMLSSQGLVSGRGQHASGVVVFPNGITEMNATMKTSKGLPITQFDARHTELAGGLKYDFLSINALDKIRAAMDMLLKDGLIKWQGSLQKTFNKYFHPDVLEMKDEKMFDLLYEGEIISSFQFETKTGRSSLEKINARNFDQLVSANSLMRLSSDGEQPIDKFVRYKNHINEWNTDMDKYGLSDREKEIMHELLDSRYGVCETQEAIMEIALHKEVASYNLREAKKLRKASAKKDVNIQKVQKEHFFNSGLKNGTSENFLNYIWEEQYIPTFGYSFSSPHVTAYTMILMIEMNIVLRYGAHYWKAACLNVDSGILGETETGTAYDKIAKVLSNFKQDILPPSINYSDLGFTPNKTTKKIQYGLKPIVGINKAIANGIISHRPYISFNDFLDKNVETEGLTKSKIIILIKAGLFDEFNKNRKEVMIDYIKLIEPLKEKLSTVVIKKIENLIPVRFNEEIEILKFSKIIKSLKNHNDIEYEYMKKYHKEAEKNITKKYPNDYYYDNDGKFIIEYKVFEKLLKIKMDGLKEWLKTNEALNIEAGLRRRELWKKSCMGSIAKWEMQSLMFYINEHELDYHNEQIAKYFDIENFNILPKEPEITGWSNGRGKKWPKYKSSVIIGTVIGTLAKKGIATLITQNGVVDIRVGKGRFQYYNKKIMIDRNGKRVNIDDTWFKRGTILVAVGYRRENDFYINSKNSQYEHALIKVDTSINDLGIQQSKRNSDDY